jgi:hypothetical protein
VVEVMTGLGAGHRMGRPVVGTMTERASRRVGGVSRHRIGLPVTARGEQEALGWGPVIDRIAA